MKESNLSNKRSELKEIHEKGLKAIIDGDNYIIVDNCRPEEVDDRIFILQNKFDDVAQDADGDIIFYREI